MMIKQLRYSTTNDDQTTEIPTTNDDKTTEILYYMTIG